MKRVKTIIIISLQDALSVNSHKMGVQYDHVHSLHVSNERVQDVCGVYVHAGRILNAVFNGVAMFTTVRAALVTKVCLNNICHHIKTPLYKVW